MNKSFFFVFLLMFVFCGSLVSAFNFNISERTEYGISENQVFLRVCDNLGKAQYIDVSSVFSDDVLTRGIVFNDDFEMKQPYNNIVWEDKLVSIGKYSMSNVSSLDSKGNKSKVNVTRYYDAKGVELVCESVLVDKSCMQTKSINTKNFTSMEYQILPVLKDKIVVDGLKIEQKSSGIPLAKGSCVELKYSYKHPLAYKLEVPEKVNKYDIWIDNGQEQTILDPLWWNGSYDEKMLINCSGMSAGSPLVINGSSGFDLGNGKQIVWTNCQENLSVYYFSTNTTRWTIANDTSAVAWETELGNNTGYNPTSVWNSASVVGVWHFSSDTGTLVDSAGYNNLTRSGDCLNGSNYLGGSIKLNGCYWTKNNPVGLPTGANQSTAIIIMNLTNINNTGTVVGWGATGTKNVRALQITGTTRVMNFVGYASDWSSGKTIPPVNSGFIAMAFGYNGTNRFVHNSTDILFEATSWIATTGTTNIGIGTSFWATTELLYADVSEIRIINSTYSNATIIHINQNLAGNAGFGTLGSVENYCAENLTNSSPVFVQNLSCLSSDLLNQSWNFTTYDLNACGFTANSTTTFYSQNVSCNYCSYSVVNASGNWSNISCVLGDLMNQTRNITEYDANYSTCYAVTNLSSDLWNSGNNNTYIQYQLGGVCDWCVSDLQNTSWSNWSNQVCLNTGYWQQMRTLVQYDLNNCSDYSNFTFSDYTSNSSNCTSGVSTGGEITFAPMLIIFILALFSFVMGLVFKQPIILLVAGVLFVVLSAMGFSSYGVLLGSVFLVFTLMSVVFGLMLAWS